MFGFSTNEKIIKKQSELINKLELENAQLKSTKSLDEKLEKNCSDFAVDFEKMNAFSIERMPAGDGIYKTSIGYFFGDQVKEWVLWCDRDTHNGLAEQFRNYMNKGKKK